MSEMTTDRCRQTPEQTEPRQWPEGRHLDILLEARLLGRSVRTTWEQDSRFAGGDTEDLLELLEDAVNRLNRTHR